MPALDSYGGRKSYYTEDEMAMFRNPERYYYGPAKGSAEKFFAGINSKARSRQMGEAAASQAIPTSYASFGTQSTSPNLSLSGFSGQTSGGTAGLAGLSNYANGGMVQAIRRLAGGGVVNDAQGIGSLFQAMVERPKRINL